MHWPWQELAKARSLVPQYQEGSLYRSLRNVAETADIVVVGAGIIGLCAALQLARRTRGRIVVLDKGSAPGTGSTGASSAVCRAKYSRAETVRLASEGIAAHRHWGEFVGLRDPVARYHQTGVLWLGTGGDVGAQAEARRLSALGVVTAVLDDAVLAERYPAINPCPISPDLVHGETHACTGGGSHLVELEGGYVDPMDALQDLLRANREHGVTVRFDAEVTGVVKTGGAVTGVMHGREAIDCGALLNAAGPWCTVLNGLAGLQSRWPLKATRIQIVHVDCPDTVIGDLPACADPAGGIYFRPQNRGRQIVVGSILEEDERETVDPSEFDGGVDTLFAAAKLHALQHRVRGLDALHGVRGYSGLYTMNVADVHPVIGRTPVPGYYVANGFSGHGFKLAPAIGSLIAQVIAGTDLQEEDATAAEFLSYARAPIDIATRSVLA